MKTAQAGFTQICRCAIVKKEHNVLLKPVLCRKGGNMGKQDKIMTRYVSDPDHFADFINGTLFQGRQMLDAKTIIPVPQRKVEKSASLKGAPLLLDGTRDAVMKQDINGIYSVFAVKAQTEVHYAMPVKTLGYDVTDYISQVHAITKDNRRNKTYTTSAEFLSGMGTGDRLTPVFTVVFYYGENKWDGPLTLREMFEIPAELMPFEQFLPEYRVMLVQPGTVEPENFRGDWKTIFETLKCAASGEEMEEYVECHTREYREMERDSVELLLSMLYELDAYQETKKQIQDSLKEEEKEGNIMCKAFDEIREKYRNIGRAEGLAEGHEEGLAEGHMKGENSLVALISAMTRDGRASELPRLGEEPGFLEEMKKAYHL